MDRPQLASHGRARPALGGASPRPTIHAATLVALLAVGCTELPRTYSSESADAVPIFRDDFERDELGPAWRVTGEGARIDRWRRLRARRATARERR